MQTLLATLTLGAAQSAAINMLLVLLDGLNYLGFNDFFLSANSLLFLPAVSPCFRATLRTSLFLPPLQLPENTPHFKKTENTQRFHFSSLAKAEKDSDIEY